MKNIIFIFFIFFIPFILNADYLKKNDIQKYIILKDDIPKKIKLENIKKPTIIIVKKNNCRWFRKWIDYLNEDLSHKNSQMKELMEMYNFIVVDNKKDIYPKQIGKRVSPSFFLVKDGIIENELEGISTAEDIQDSFNF